MKAVMIFALKLMVKIDNIARIAAAGADMFVAGSAIFGQPDYEQVITQMRQNLAKVAKIGEE